MPAPQAELLMRSRYTAFVLRDEPYLLLTWHPSRRPARIPFTPDQVWLDLTVIETQLGVDSAEVEFVARSRIGGSELRHHERSRFVRDNGVWLYLDGVMRA
jgi:SEC-C motif-containing protein